MSKDDALLKRLLATFKVEAADHVTAISSGLLDLEKSGSASSRAELTEVVFRETHSLKGAARTVNLSAVESLCQSMENIFSVLKKRAVELTPDSFDLLHRALDLVRNLLGALDKEGAIPGKLLAKDTVKEMVYDLDRTAGELEGKAPLLRAEPVRESLNSDGPVAEPPKPLTPETIRVEKSKLDAVLLQVEELVQAKQSLGERTSELRGLIASVTDLEKRWSAAQSNARAVGLFLKKDPAAASPSISRSSATLFDFFESGRDLVKTLHGGLSLLDRKIENDRRSVTTMVDGLLGDAKRISMTPFSTLSEILARTVRNLLAAQGKQAELSITGGDLEVDRRILEEMKDPLIHLLRNCVDHGIEKPGERALRGKPSSGKISVSVSHCDSGKVELLVADDGPGIDLARVRTSAVRLGILSAQDAERLDEERLRGIIFRSGVSASPFVTDLSGRGLGLAIVQEKVERLGGVVSCESSPGNGTVFRILLPVSLATIIGLLVRVKDRRFVIPAASVRRAMRASSDEIRTVEGKETVSFDGMAVPLVQLASVLELSPGGVSTGKGDLLSIVVLEGDEKLIAFAVDEVVREQEFLIKGLGRQLRRVRNVSGATVLEGGKVAPIINVPDLIKSAVKGAEAVPSITLRERETTAKQSILVVEDSVTARALLKNIMEAAGYDVKIAIDGVDAYALLKTEPFDLVVSDLDMPRMNGFELTEKIRSDKKLAELPVVLVTALDSREDRERGIDAGANAYIVKSSFDQSNLLEAIKRLI